MHCERLEDHCLLVGDLAPLLDIRPGNRGSQANCCTEVVNFNDEFFFFANDGTSGNELWKSEGTAAGTVLVKDINPGIGNSFPVALNNLNGTRIFRANDGTTGTERWRSDGTAAGTVLVKDINSGKDSSTLTNSKDVNGTLFFAANDGTNGREFW